METITIGLERQRERKRETREARRFGWKLIISYARSTYDT
jgi:hypothetical protein